MTTRILILAIFATVVGTYAWRREVSAQRQNLEDSRAVLGSTKARHDALHAQIQEAQQEISVLEQTVQERKKLSGTRDSLTADVAELERSRDALLKAFRDEVERVRVEMRSLIVPEVTLADGTLLRNVSITSISGDEVALTHSQGLMRVSAAGLPEQLSDRLRISASPMLGEAGQIASAATSTPGADAPSGVPMAGASAPGVQLSAAGMERVKSAETELRMYQAKEAEMRRTQGAYMAQAQDYRKKDSEARFVGKPERYQQLLPKITQAINAIDVQLGELSSKIVSLKIEVDSIKEGQLTEPAPAPDSPR